MPRYARFGLLLRMLRRKRRRTVRGETCDDVVGGMGEAVAVTRQLRKMGRPVAAVAGVVVDKEEDEEAVVVKRMPQGLRRQGQ